MPEVHEHSEVLGSVEVQMQILKQRIEEAAAEHRRAQFKNERERGIFAKQVEQTRKDLEERHNEYDDFMAANFKGESQQPQEPEGKSHATSIN